MESKAEGRVIRVWPPINPNNSPIECEGNQHLTFEARYRKWYLAIGGRVDIRVLHVDMNLVTKALSTDSVEVLKELSEHEEPSVRMAVASNPLHDPLWWVNDVDMMYFYWQDQRLRDKDKLLPEELHNSMITLAMNGDEKANKYVDHHG